MGGYYYVVTGRGLLTGQTRYWDAAERVWWESRDKATRYRSFGAAAAVGAALGEGRGIGVEAV